MTDAIPLPFNLPAVAGKKCTVAFDGGNQSSDGGVLLLRQAEARLGVCRRLAKSACRKEIGERLANLAREARNHAWDKVQSVAELLGQLHDSYERGRSVVEIRDRLDRIEKALAKHGRLTPQIEAEFRAIRIRLDANR